MKNKRLGVLLPVSSLPSRYGIGDFGETSFKFIDWIKKNHYKYWQILPLNPLGPGNSPYMSSCSMAIEYRYINLDALVDAGFIEGPLPDMDKDLDYVNFEDSGAFKEYFLKIAFKSFIKKYPHGLDSFKKNNHWASEYATFQYLKKRNNLDSWNHWKKRDRDYYLHHKRAPKNAEIKYYIFVQMVATYQWKKVLNYARKNKVKIISDVPFYVGYDSIECWLHQDQFSFDENGNQTEVGGVPPDAFTDVGQLWGSPIYHFDKMKEDNYSLLVDRIGYLGQMCDILRLDHFRAFDTYYVIPAGMPDAKIGEWRVGPRDEFFEALYKKYPKTNLIAEDLGDLFPSVLELRDRLHLHGMYIMEFTIFDLYNPSNNSLIVYPGTHDNETLWGWFNNLSKDQHQFLMDRLHTDKKHLYTEIFKYMYNAPSYMSIFQLQDFLKLGNEGRINSPGTIGYPNWSFRLKDWDWVNHIVYPKKSW